MTNLEMGSSFFLILALHLCYNFPLHQHCMNLHNLLCPHQYAWTVQKTLYPSHNLTLLPHFCWPHYGHQWSHLILLDLDPAMTKKASTFPVTNLNLFLLEFWISNFNMKHTQNIETKLPEPAYIFSATKQAKIPEPFWVAQK